MKKVYIDVDKYNPVAGFGSPGVCGCTLKHMHRQWPDDALDNIATNESRIYLGIPPNTDLTLGNIYKNISIELYSRFTTNIPGYSCQRFSLFRLHKKILAKYGYEVVWLKKTGKHARPALQPNKEQFDLAVC